MYKQSGKELDLRHLLPQGTFRFKVRVPAQSLLGIDLTVLGKA